jgi:hypothetical protein
MITKANNLGNLAITLADLTSLGGNGVNRPASGVSWNEAARFINWLNASTGSPLAYKFALQPGDSGYIANANIQLWTPSDAGYNPSNLYRNSLAHYFLPSENEWYKAAYYDPVGGFHDYPTGSSIPIAPTPVASGTAAGTAVFSQPHANGPADITLAGGLSRYGTMGQGGNVYELIETDYDLVNGPTLSSNDRDLRGSAWSHDLMAMHVGTRLGISQTSKSIFNGFRVASTIVPEPSTLVLAVGVFAPLAAYRRRRGRGNTYPRPATPLGPPRCAPEPSSGLPHAQRIVGQGGAGSNYYL